MSPGRRQEDTLPTIGELLGGETPASRTFLRGIIVGALVGAMLAGLAAGRRRLEGAATMRRPGGGSPR